MSTLYPLTPHNARLRNWLPVLFIAICSVLQAAQVSEEAARTVAVHFLRNSSPTFHDLRVEDLELIHTDADVSAEGSTVLYRIFATGADGFVIVSGDDLVMPILGYSTDSRIDMEGIPVHVAKWFEEYRLQIRDAVAAAQAPHEDVVEAWEKLLSGEELQRSGGERDVPPLLSTTWNQSPHYNALCPGGSVTGCVATAMAQVMKYHQHPITGAGFHSYNAPNYGTLSANFGATTYNWAGMPNNVSSANNNVATLMYHCGVSVDMQYSPQISGAWVIQAHSPSTDHNTEYALKTYFGYSNSMQGLKRENYSEQQWVNMVKADLDASRPILYAGWGSGGGHAFVCDGYDNNNFFHFNWGWGGMADGYFTINALNPGSTGTGGGSGGYNSGHQAIFGVEPATGGGGGGNPTVNQMGLYNFVSPSSSMLYYGQAFSVSTNIINNGSTEFSGDYCAAVFDANSNFYGFVEVLSGYTLPAGYVYNNDLVFSTSGLYSMLPGTYYIGVFHRPTGGEWVLVEDNGGYTNFPMVTVINPNAIEMYSSMQLSPGSTVEQGDQFSVALNLLNDGFETFYGQYGVALYDLEGNWVQDVGLLNENNGLPPGYAYNDPQPFGPVTITAPPGTYLLAVQHNPSNTGWQLVGSSYYANPVFVTVVAAGISPDQYEANNTSGQSFTLPVSFSGNFASVATTGSNLHSNTEIDFYKVVLPAGNNYAVSARLHDSYNSGNGQSYTVDAAFSYSTDGSSWSSVFDDIMPGEVILQGGGTVYFQVVPYFQGEIGTYLLDIDIERGQNVGISESIDDAAILLYPNPATDQLMVDPIDGSNLERVQILDMQGQIIAELMITPAAGRSVIDLGSIADGAYLIKLMTNKNEVIRKFTIAR